MTTITFRLTVLIFLALVIGSVLMGSGIAPAAYNLIQNNTVPIARRSTINFVNGGCVDNAGTQASDCTFLATVPANATCTFTAQTTVACTHNLGTTAVTVAVYDNASPPNLIIPATEKITNANVVTVTFSTSTSGTVVVSGSSGSSSGQISFQSNSVAVGAGTTLNLIPGTNVTISSSGPTGGVVSYTINSSGGGGGTPGGSATQWQYNNSGSFGGLVGTSAIPQSGWTIVGSQLVYNDFSNAIQSIHSAHQGSTSLQSITRLLPSSTSYTATVTLDIKEPNTDAAQLVGLVISNGTIYRDFEVVQQGTGSVSPELRVLPWTNVTSPGSPVSSTTGNIVGQTVTLKIVGDNVNRTYFYWSNGAFVQFFQEAIGTALTETRVGVSVLSIGSNAAGWTDANILYWSLTSP